MKKKTKKIILGLLLVLIVATGAYFIWKSFVPSVDKTANEDEDAYEVYSLYEQDPISVKGTVTLEVNDSYTYKEEFGEIETVHVEDGQVVEKGQALYTYRKSSGPEQKAVNEADRQVKLLVAQRDRLAAHPPAPAPALAPEGEEEIPASNFKAEHDAQLADLNAQIEAANAALNEAIEALTTTVTAANAGTVKLNTQGRTNASKPFIHIVGNEVFINGSVNEFNFFALSIDQKVTINVQATGDTIEGIMTSYDEFPPAQEASYSTSTGADGMASAMGANPGHDAMAASSNQLFNFIVRPNQYIQPGFSVEMLIHVPGIVIPEEAIVEENDQYFVFIYEKGKVKKHEITLERQGLNRITTEKTFKPGTLLILHPEGLEDGAEIKVSQDEDTIEYDETNEVEDTVELNVKENE